MATAVVYYTSAVCEGDKKYRRGVYTSTRLQESRYVAFDVNVRLVLLAHELGMGYAALKKISKVKGQGSPSSSNLSEA